MLVNYELAELDICHAIVNAAFLMDDGMPCRPRQL